MFTVVYSRIGNDKDHGDFHPKINTQSLRKIQPKYTTHCIDLPKVVSHCVKKKQSKANTSNQLQSINHTLHNNNNHG